MRTQHVDVAVLGAGSGGERLATELAGRAVDGAVGERRRVGGAGPFFACIPSKAMLVSAAARATVGAAEDLGATGGPIVLQPGAEAFLRAVRRRDEAAAGHDDGDHVKSLHDAGAQLIRGEGRVTGAGSLEVVGPDGTTQVAFDHLVIATGSQAVVPDVPGLADATPWTYEEAWTARRRPRSMLVLGGGPVGCEIAQAYARFGADVTLADASSLLGGAEEPEIAADRRRALEDDDVTVLEGVDLDRVEPADGGHVAVFGDRRVAVDQIVVAIGTRPRTGGLGLERLGIDPDDLRTDDRCRVEGADDVWAIGDVTDVAPFTHTANYQAAIAAANILGEDATADYRAIPRAVYTSPEVAAVGLTREQAEEAGIDAVSVAFDLGATARASVEGVAAGRLVLVGDRSDRTLVGASLAGPSAGESVSEFALAIKARATADLLADLVHPFPTWTEGFGPAIEDLCDALDRGALDR